MAAKGGLAGATGNETTVQTVEGPPQPVPARASTNAPHLRIVQSVDRDDSGTPPTRAERPSRKSPRSLTSEVLIDRSIQSRIGRMLRDVYCDVASEPVPDRFVELLEALAAQEEQQ
jgi:hypothetical protein